MDEAWWVQGFLIVAFYGLPLPISDSRFERVFHLFDNVLDSFENSWQIAVHFDVSFDIHGVHIAVNPQASVETDVVLICGQLCFLFWIAGLNLAQKALSESGRLSGSIHWLRQNLSALRRQWFLFYICIQVGDSRL